MEINAAEDMTDVGISMTASKLMKSSKNENDIANPARPKVNAGPIVNAKACVSVVSYSSFNKLLPAHSGSRVEIACKSIPDKLLSTEEDLNEDDSEMVIDEEIYPENNDVDNEVELLDRNTCLTEERGADLPAIIQSGEARNPSPEIEMKPKNYVSVEQDLNSGQSCSPRHPNSTAEITVKDDMDKLRPKMKLPFTFPGQSFNEQAQKLILNVWDFFKRVKKNPSLLNNLKGPQDHAAAALNIGNKTIGKIAKRVIRLGKLETPGKKRNRPKTVLDSLGAEGEGVIKSIIKDMYERRIAPTIPLVHAEAKAKLNFKGSTTSLRRILKRMGYKYGGIDNSLIQSDKVFVSGWKERALKKKIRSSHPKTKTSKIENTTHHLQVLHVSPRASSPKSEAGRVLAQQSIADIVGSNGVIVHSRKPENTFWAETSQNQIIAVATESADIIQFQLGSNGEPLNVVQEWHWQPCQQDASAFGLKTL